MKTAQVAVVKEIEVSLSPFERYFHGWPPRCCEPDLKGNMETMLRPVPHFPRQETASNRHEQCLQLASNNLLVRWQREDTIEQEFVEVGDPYLERRQHTRSVGLHQTIR